MKCVRCGYCCTKLFAVVIKDPEGEFNEPNLITIGMFGGYERCPHLRDEEPGKYSCAVHDKEWYPTTPCAEYQSHWGDQLCRLGELLVSKKSKNITK